MNDAPEIAGSKMETEARTDWSGAPDSQIRARIKRLRRANAILKSQQMDDGAVKPLDRWPRKLRREFSRLAAKEERVAARLSAGGCDR